MGGRRYDAINGRCGDCAGGDGFGGGGGGNDGDGSFSDSGGGGSLGGFSSGRGGGGFGCSGFDNGRGAMVMVAAWVAVLVFMVGMLGPPPGTHAMELPLGKNGAALKQLIGYNLDFGSRMSIAIRDIIYTRRTSGCSPELHEKMRLAVKAGQLFAREMALLSNRLYKDTLKIQDPELTTNCPNQCQGNELTCKNGNCIPLARRCDGKNDCGDASDEGPACMSGCGPNSFRCSTDQRCLPVSLRCDGIPHCIYGVDEYCQTSCGSRQFLCRVDKRCIDIHWTCDGAEDCSDGADERLCGGGDTERPDHSLRVCRPGELRCARDNTCVPDRLVCDGTPDCSDGSDEWTCPHIPITTTTTTTTTPPTLPTPPPHTTTPQRPVCPGGMFECVSSRRCVYQWWVCDGYRECEDGSDEVNCFHGVNCSPNHFFCLRDKSCIDSRRRCDGAVDCSDGTDEAHCPHTKPSKPVVTHKPKGKFCGHGEFRCVSDHYCIPIYLVCNAVPNCNDGSDEAFCPSLTTTTTTTTTQSVCSGFMCSSGFCIPAEHVCDGYRDCSGADDERNCDARTSTTTPPTTPTTTTTTTTDDPTGTTTTPPPRFGMTSTTTALVPITFTTPSTTPTTTPTTTTTITSPTTPANVPVGPNLVSCRPGFFPCTANSCVYERLACSVRAINTCILLPDAVRALCQRCGNRSPSLRTCINLTRGFTSSNNIKGEY